jgi:probable rRNA maturation factor
VTSAVEVVNRTRVPVGAAAVAELVSLVLAAEGAAGAEVGVTFVGERRMRALNREHRARDAVTDVLAFPLEDEEEIAVVRDAEGGAAEAAAPDGPPRLLGDVVICARRALRQARAAGLPPAAELAVLLVHGTLHLLGYDHETDAGHMALRQAELLEAARWEGLVGTSS